jgi:hypothetical protein
MMVPSGGTKEFHAGAMSRSGAMSRCLDIRPAYFTPFACGLGEAPSLLVTFASTFLEICLIAISVRKRARYHH